MWKPVSVALVLAALVLSIPAQANDGRYIKENFRVSIRVGSSENSEPVGFMTAGDKVTVTKATGSWSYVVDEKGLEGWVQTAQLIDYEPAIQRVSVVEADNAALRQEYERVNNELDRLRIENGSLRQLLDGNNEQTKACLVLLEETDGNLTGLLDMKEDFDRIKNELTGKEARLKYLEDTSSRAEFYTYLRWFLSGAGVLLVGFFIGLIVKRNNNNRRYY